MCVPAPQLLLFTTMASGIASYQAHNAGARATLRAGKKTAERIEHEKQVAKLNAEQETTELMRSFSESMASNIAFRAMLGRDVSDPSFKAFEKNNYDTYETDIKRIGIQANQIEKNYDLQKQEAWSGAVDTAKALRRKGRTSLLLGTLEGIHDYKAVKRGDD
tara:strand:- start:513 stop:998 length:486 start_codon:yes stop_codon:yes gene_type:complete